VTDDQAPVDEAESGPAPTAEDTTSDAAEPTPTPPVGPGHDAADVDALGDDLDDDPADDFATDLATDVQSQPSDLAPGVLRTGIWSRRVPTGRAVLVIVVMVVAMLAWGSTTESSFVLVEPGPVFNLTEQVTGDVKDPTFREHGTMFLTTVSVVPLRWYEYVKEKVSPTENSQVLPAEDLTGRQRNQFDHVEGAQMRTAKETALAVAAARVGLTGPVQPQGAVVLDVSDGSPAQAAGLQIGDVIVSASGTPVAEAETLSEAIQSTDASVPLVVERRGAPQTITVTPNQEDGRRRIGVEVSTKLTPTDGVPELDADLARVGGPSGGLMLTLAFIDALGEGDLTGDTDLSGTGTISPDGTVGPISGASDKIVAAKKADAKVFFSPAANARKIRSTAGIDVVPVETVDDAINWLCQHGATDQICTTRTSG
jgi:PDZ domain-containing protein